MIDPDTPDPHHPDHDAADPDELIDLPRLAADLRCSVPSIRQVIARGKLRPRHVVRTSGRGPGRQTVLRRAEVCAWLADER